MARPKLAFLLRVLLFIAPGVIAWFAVRWLAPNFIQVDGVLRLPVWIIQAIIVSFSIAKAVGVVAARLVPLPGLLAMALVFPNQAPSRFGAALRAGSTKNLKDGIVTLSSDEGEAAVEALALVTAMNRHDRLTRGHMERVRAYSEMIGRELDLSDEDLNKLRWASLLHDIGKLEVPAGLLGKTRKPLSLIHI